MSRNVYLGQHQPCPVCNSSDAYSVYADGHGYCFSCKKYTRDGIHIPHITSERRDSFLSSDYTYEYLPWRGINAETFKHYECKTKIDAEGKPVCVGFRYANGAHKIRTIASKEFYSEGDIGAAGLFGKDRFAAGSKQWVVVTEGELDALSFYQVLKGPCVSIQSAATVVRDLRADYDFLQSFDRVYLAFDSDSPGMEAVRAGARIFPPGKVFHVKFSNRKDANEYLQHGEETELKTIWQNSKKYVPASVVSSLSEFKDILSQTQDKGISFPFPTLDKMAYGIRPYEIVLLTAMEGVGKTEIMHTLEHHILKETDDAVAALFLEEPRKRHLQALAGLELERPVHLPDSGIEDDAVFSAVETLVRRDDRLHVVSYAGCDDPDSLLDTVRYLVCAYNCRYVLLDHLSMVTSNNNEQDERRQIDYLCARLDLLVQELGFSLIMVSHVNDEGQTRGSRYISKVAHLRIDATRDISHPDPEERNRIYLNVSKNRFAGKSGPAGILEFNQKTFSLKEKVPFEEAA